MTKKGRAVVLHGATAERPDEADTLRQAEEVAAALGRLGWEARIRTLGSDPEALDRKLQPRPDFLFNLVEAIDGDGSQIDAVPRALDRLGLRYSGAGARAMRLTTDKPLAKRLLRGAGLPTPDWIGPETEPARAEVIAAGHPRFIVKSTREDASLGIDAGSVVPGARVAREVAARAARFGGAWFAEAYIEGREFNLGLLDSRSRLEALPIAEIRFLDFPAGRPRIVDYEAKWDESSHAYSHTPRCFDLPAADAALLEEMRRLARRAFRIFGLAGYARIDFRVDAAGRPWILEANANPCLTADAGFMAAARQAGLGYDEVIARIVEAAAGESIRAVA